MKLSSFKRLIKTDYDEKDQDLVEQLSFSLNNAIESIVTALNKNVSLSDNMLCTVKDIEVMVDNNGFPREPIVISLGFTGTASQILCGRAENLSNPSVYPVSGILLSFTQSGTRININHIAGLPAGYKFNLRVTIFG